MRAALGDTILRNHWSDRFIRVAIACFAVCAFGSKLVLSTGQAQTFTTIRSFGNPTNVSGMGAQCQLVQGLDGTLYGTASYGDCNVAGTIFKVQPDGTGFAVLKWFTNSFEGANPKGGLTLSGNTLYGTTYDGGAASNGVVFQINIDGTGYAVLKSFSALTFIPFFDGLQYVGGISTNEDGANPSAVLTLSGSTLYGTTTYGGAAGCGTVFKLNVDGSGYAVLMNYWANHSGGLVQSGNSLYGTTYYGGNFVYYPLPVQGQWHDSGYGTIFKVNTDGTGYSIVKAFDILYYYYPTYRNVTGSFPYCTLTLSGNVLYGTTAEGGAFNSGTVFQVNTDGTGFSVLENFSATRTNSLGVYVNSDGANPQAGVVLLNGALYGATYGGGSMGYGTIFTLSTNGSGYTVLKQGDQWTAPQANLMLSSNVIYGTGFGAVFKMNTDGTGYTWLKTLSFSDAAYPQGYLLLAGGVLYGVTSTGGSQGGGAVFKLNVDGTGYTILKDLGVSTGAQPGGGLIMSNDTLYGTTYLGGSYGHGTVFKLGIDGTGYTALKNFLGGADGEEPDARLTFANGVLFGTTVSGGQYGYGRIFKLKTDGSDYTMVKDFYGSDGANPGALTLSGNTLYGTTGGGGNAGGGVLFAVSANGAYTLLRNFTNYTGAGPGFSIGLGTLAVSGSTLYGTTLFGGTSNLGAIFKMNTDGSGYEVLKSFTGNEGWLPGELILSGNKLYGTAGGGTYEGDTAFQLNTDGTGFTVLNNFIGNPQGTPAGAEGLILSGNRLYGATQQGGVFGLGSVFKIELPSVTPIPLNAQSQGRLMILSWNNPAFLLQAAPEVFGTYTNIAGATSPYTNAISGNKSFFRLIGN